MSYYENICMRCTAPLSFYHTRVIPLGRGWCKASLQSTVSILLNSCQGTVYLMIPITDCILMHKKDRRRLHGTLVFASRPTLVPTQSTPSTKQQVPITKALWHYSITPRNVLVGRMRPSQMKLFNLSCKWSVSKLLSLDSRDWFV